MHDAESQSMYLINGDQWVSFDNTMTFNYRRNWADGKCLGGLMWWSADMIYTDLTRFDPSDPNNPNNGGGNGGSGGGDPNENPSPDYLSFGGNKISEAMRHCYKGFLEKIPPTFCYKKNPDFGKIPTDCPNGYFRSLAMCYENCR